jgi:hypothetical protein
VIGLFPCGVRLGFFIYGVGVERMSRQGGGDKKKLCLYTCLCVHLFLRFVLVQSINFSAQIKGEDSFFLLFLAGFYRIISLLQKKSGKGKK